MREKETDRQIMDGLRKGRANGKERERERHEGRICTETIR